MRRLIVVAVGAALLAGLAPTAQAQGYYNHRADHRYGRWDNGWGHRPPPPPRHWRRQADWHRHVHACQVRYRGYDAHRDAYVWRSGWRSCRL